MESKPLLMLFGKSCRNEDYWIKWFKLIGIKNKKNIK